jgi:hypothetical protein
MQKGNIKKKNSKNNPLEIGNVIKEARNEVLEFSSNK